jgi:hypothetical protein
MLLKLKYDAHFHHMNNLLYMHPYHAFSSHLRGRFLDLGIKT